MNGNCPRFLPFKVLVWSYASPPHALPLSTAAAVAKDQNRFIVVDYLINSCGLSEKKAVAASASLAHLKSPAKPDSVLKFLTTCGLNDAQITTFISSQPRLLCSNVEKSLAPRFKMFQNLGISSPEIAEILRKTSLLRGKLDTHLVLRIEFLRSILSNDQDLVRVLKRSAWSLTASNEICKRMTANISTLKDLGVSAQQIKKFIPRYPRFFQLKSDLFNTTISRVESELGVPRHSGMFLYAASTLYAINQRAIGSRFQILEDFGWSMTEIHTLFRNQPKCLEVSDEKLRRGLAFLMRSADLSPSYIANRPTLLMVNFEKRLFPRYEVFSTLKLKNLISQEQCFYAAVCISEKSFLEKYVMRFKQIVPDVCEAYLNREGLTKTTVDPASL